MLSETIYYDIAHFIISIEEKIKDKESSNKLIDDPLEDE